MPNKRRVAVTGLGPVTPIGTGRDQFWEALREGRSGVGPVTKFDTEKYPVKIAAEIPDFNIDDYLEPRRARRMIRFTQLAFAATKLALEDAILKPSDPDPTRVGIVIGSGIGGIALTEEEHEVLLAKGPRYVSPELVAKMIPNAASGSLAIELGFSGPNDCTVTACASSGHAISRAVDILRSGAADIMIAGGTEAAITPLSLAGFCTARALSRRNDEPERASRPFDAKRDGFVLGEGATVLVLEEMEVAKARGAPILAEVLGHGLSSDAHHMVMPHPEGAGASTCMTSALADADLAPSEVGYISAHGTATQLGDAAEAAALHKIFGDAPPPTSAIKSMTGHLLGAAGSTAVAATVLALNEQVLPPTINYENPDPDCDLDVVPNQARPHKFEVAMSNSFGFGGHNASILIAKPA
ncbi:MAG: beta-ketoacyl-ACP synthase II [Actinomycetota bacterium]|nr:beta-ketoacyl-ACP synthase II [Actinomycetota bacterium]